MNTSIKAAAGTKQYAQALLEFFQEEHPESKFTLLCDKSGWHYVACDWKEEERQSEILEAPPEPSKAQRILAQADENWKRKHMGSQPAMRTK